MITLRFRYSTVDRNFIHLIIKILNTIFVRLRRFRVRGRKCIFNIRALKKFHHFLRGEYGETKLTKYEQTISRKRFGQGDIKSLCFLSSYILQLSHLIEEYTG